MSDDEGAANGARAVAVGLRMGGMRMTAWITNGSSGPIDGFTFTLIVPRAGGAERVAVQPWWINSPPIPPGRRYEAEVEWPEPTLAGVRIQDVDCEVGFRDIEDREFVIVASTDEVFRIGASGERRLLT